MQVPQAHHNPKLPQGERSHAAGSRFTPERTEPQRTERSASRALVRSRVRLSRHLQALRPARGEESRAAPDDLKPSMPVKLESESRKLTMMRSVLGVFQRIGRLSMDAALILVFSPVIAIWLLREAWHRRKSR